MSPKEKTLFGNRNIKIHFPGSLCECIRNPASYALIDGAVVSGHENIILPWLHIRDMNMVFADIPGKNQIIRSRSIAWIILGIEFYICTVHIHRLADDRNSMMLRKSNHHGIAA